MKKNPEKNLPRTIAGLREEMRARFDAFEARMAGLREDEESFARYIFDEMCGGRGIEEIADKDVHIAPGMLLRWFIEEHGDLYDRALRLKAHKLVHEALDAADGTGDVNRDKLKSDVRLKVATKWDKPRYGDHQEIKHTGSLSLVAVLSGMPKQERLIEGEEVEPEKIPAEITEKVAA